MPGPDRGRPGSGQQGGNRPGKDDNSRNQPKSPDKNSGGTMPPHADPKKGGK